jgi:hypothetical protein
MASKPRMIGVAVLILLCALMGAAAFAYRRCLLERRGVVSGILQNDLVRGSDGKLYRRLVRVARANHTITTTVTFTDTASGGGGKATYVQPDLPPEPPLLQLKRHVWAGLGLPTRPLRELPLMSIPQPMKPGEKWFVRIHLKPNECWTEGQGRAPKGASFVPPDMLIGRLNTAYGERIPFVF